MGGLVASADGAETVEAQAEFSDVFSFSDVDFRFFVDVSTGNFKLICCVVGALLVLGGALVSYKVDVTVRYRAVCMSATGAKQEKV